jgi:hypothetical protein
MAFEHVYTVWDYWDGPRSGLANLFGEAHAYSCKWDEVEDDYTDRFLLTPIDPETLSLAVEQWAIWRKWESEFHEGRVAESAHPRLPGQNSRYAELEVLIKATLTAQPRWHAIATFRARPNQATRPRGVLSEMEVEWKNVEHYAQSL